MKERERDIVRNYMTDETGARSVEEMKRLLAAIIKTSEEFPSYFCINPATKKEIYKREVFILTTKIEYFKGHVSETCIDRLKHDLFDANVRVLSLH